MEYHAQQKQSLHNFHFGCDSKERFLEIKQYLRRLSDANENSPCRVVIELENEQLALNATVLSALSPYWRSLVDRCTQDSPIVYKISPVLSSGACGFLPLIKLLIYNGLVSLSVLYIKDIMAILRELHLEATNFVLTNTGNEVETLTWENHFELLMKGLQIMCKKQQCADLSVFVENHVIKVHRLVLSSYSEVLNALFQENDKIRTLHFPGISLKSAHTLIGYMYHGKAILPPAYIEDFVKLCKCMKVSRLTNKLQMQKLETKIKDKLPVPLCEKQGNVFITVEPEIALVVKRLLLLFDVKDKTDLTLVVGNKRIYTQKSLLGITCPSFHTVLMEEHSNEQSAILLADEDPISVTAVITLLHKGSCLITRSQMNIAASYLDSGLFKLHMSNDITLQSVSNEDAVMSFDDKINIPNRLGNIRNGDKVSSGTCEFPENTSIKNKMENHKSVKVYSYNYGTSTDTNNYGTSTDTTNYGTSTDTTNYGTSTDTTVGIDGQSVEGHNSSRTSITTNLSQEDKIDSADTLPKKRPRRSKSYNCDEWVTAESEIKAAIFGKYPAKPLIPEKSFQCRICDKMFSSKSSLNGHMQVHSDQSSSNTSVFKNCKSIMTSRAMCKKKRSYKSSLCRFCKRYFRRERLEQHIKSKHSQKESDNDVNEDIKNPKRDRKYLEYNGLPVTQSRPGDCSRTHENKKQNFVTLYKNTSPQKYYKGNKEDPEKLSEHSTLPWNCDICNFQCSNHKSLLQHESDFHQNTSKEIVCDGTLSHPSVPFKMFNIDEYQLDKSNSFECPECGEVFSNLETFSTHAEQKGHGGLQGSCWICGVCEAAFFEEDDLNKHLVSHNTDVEGVLSSNGEKQPVTIFDQNISNGVNGCLTSIDIPNEVSKNKLSLQDKVEAD